MCKTHYEPDTLVVLINNYKANGEVHLMRVQETRHYDDEKSVVIANCLTCGGVTDRFDVDEVREATPVEKAEYRLLGAA